MSKYPKATRYYIIGGIFGLIQTAISFIVNPLIGWISLFLTAFIFLGAFFAHRGTMGWHTAPAGREYETGEFTSALCGLMLGPILIVAIMITFLVPIGGGTFPNFLYAIPAILAGVFTFIGGIRVIMKI